MATNQHYNVFVPDEGPTHAKILFIGEAPGEQEMEEGRPFIGTAGQLLMRCLERNGIQRSEVRLANLCNYRPYHNKFEYLLNTEVLREGLKKTVSYIQQYRPTVVVPLGNWPLKFITGKVGISKWRGSIIHFLLDESIKCIPTYHPSFVNRKRKAYPVFDTDIKRIVQDAEFREKRLPQREFIIDPRGMDLEEWVHRLSSADTLATDIETVRGTSHILCCGFAPSPDVGVCFPMERAESRQAVSRVLSAENRKIFQFGSFDTVQLHLNGHETFDSSSGTLDRKYYWDTLIAQHALEPELPRSLEFLASVLTREPYYKQQGRGEVPADTKSWSMKANRDALYEYNVRDCCVTYEVYEKQKPQILSDPCVLDTFDFEMSMLEVADHIALSGMYRDEDRRQLLETVLLNKWAKKQFILDGLAKRDVNVRSPKLKNILYDKDSGLGLPARRKRDGTITTDEDAIVSLIAYCKGELAKRKTTKSQTDWRVKLAVCQLVLEIRGYRVALSNFIMSKNSMDHRLRSTVKVGATETGRWSFTKFVDGTGYNMQTNSRDPVEIPESELTKVGDLLILKAQLNQEDAIADETDEDADEELAA